MEGARTPTTDVRTRSVACDDFSVVSDGGELGVFDRP